MGKDVYQEDAREDVLEQSASSVSVMTAEVYPHRRDIQSRLQAQQEQNRVGEDEMTWFHRALGLKGKKPTLTRTTSFMYDQCMAAAHHPDMVAGTREKGEEGSSSLPASSVLERRRRGAVM